MRYKVWVEIEEVDEDGEHVRGGAELGVLPDCIGDCESLVKAISRQRDAVANYNPEELATSDARGSDDWRRLSIVEQHTMYCISCGELADWMHAPDLNAYCNACASELGAPDAYPQENK